MILPLLCWGRTLTFGLLLTLLAVLGATPRAQATHIRAGDIQARPDPNNPRRFFFRLTLYTVNPAPALTDNADIFFGDNTSAVVPRTTPAPVPLASNPETAINYYDFEHTYNAPGVYSVGFIGENRNRNIRNMLNSVSLTFFLQTQIIIDPTLSINTSPVLTAPAIDRATVNQVFLHNPGAFDADGDSLSYELVASQSTSGAVAVRANNNRLDNAPVPGYVLPNAVTPGRQVAYPGAAVDAAAVFTINPVTGLVVWNSPGAASIGEYNFAIRISEFRRVAGGGVRRIGFVIRDMQINVVPSTNLRPELTILPNLCVVAGTVINQTVTATDPDRNPVTLQAFGGIFPPATFQQTTAGPPTASAAFRWATQCGDVRRDPYYITFKAQDQPTGGNPVLIDEKVWEVRVIGPAPENLQVTTTGARAVLTWDRYICQQASQILIYRKEGPSGFVPGECQTGIPDGLGFVRVGAVAAGQNSFADDRNGLGLERGKTYCYRIYAVFPLPAGGESIASAEACVTLTGRSAVFRNVTVDRTAANGQITVVWSKPTSSAGFVEPLGYRLYRATGQNPTEITTLVRSTSNLNDTVFVDSNINTVGTAYAYRLEFFSNAVPGGSVVLTERAGPASSVLLTGQPDLASTGNILRWTYNVPWDNSRQPTAIFRRELNGTTFTQVATVTGTTTGGTYTDRALQTGQTYCYYVRTNGTYGAAGLPTDLINLSQELCIRAVPCTPVITLRSLNCDSLSAVAATANGVFPPVGFTYTNRLTWTLDSNNPAGCNPADIAYYRIFYQANQNAPFVLLPDSGSATSYVHRGLASPAGCYQIQAVDNIGQRSALSNVACSEECLFFLLPNIFTPNGDRVNDTFVPKTSSPIRRIKFRAFNRWGVKVYEGDQDPRINWDGGGNTGESGSTPRLPDGMYFYQAEVEFLDFNNTKRTYKGWVQINR